MSTITFTADFVISQLEKHVCNIITKISIPLKRILSVPWFRSPGMFCRIKRYPKKFLVMNWGNPFPTNHVCNVSSLLEILTVLVP